MFNIDYDDGFVAFLNGKEIARSNLGRLNEVIPFNRFSDQTGEARLYQNQKLESFFVENFETFLIDGNNVLSVQVHNSESNSSDLTAIPFLTIGYKANIATNNVADEILPLLPRLHTNFSISNGTEAIYLSNTNGQIVDSVESILLDVDVSYGRKPDGNSSWYLFTQPTPGEPNISEGFQQQVELPELSLPAGFYASTIVLSQLNYNIQNTTYYTDDGSEPNSDSQIFPTSLSIVETTVLKLKSFREGFIPSNTTTSTYFINEEKGLPIISVSMNPFDLWDYNNGFYVMGPNAETNFPHFKANFWQDWTKHGSFEYFDVNRQNNFKLDVDIKIFGGWSRGHPQKSLSIFANDKNYPEGMNYKLFPELDIQQFQSIVLRNSGNDWSSTMLRDGFMQSLGANLNVDKLAYQPSVLYLNGEYWGIHNIREKINLNYLQSHYKVNKDSIDLLELNGDVLDGSSEDYQDMLLFLTNTNMSIESNYEKVNDYIDIQNFIDYNILQIYIANTDWPGNNIKFWKAKGIGNKWRWIIFDTDFGFGFLNSSNYNHNTLKFALETNGPEWPNPPWSTFILRKLLQNPIFKKDFINRFADIMNTEFKSEVVKAKLGKMKDVIKDEIYAHIEKWGEFSYGEWENNLMVLETFADLRISKLRSHIATQFSFSGTKVLVLDVSDDNAGKISINTITPAQYPWYGSYFMGNKIKLTAISNPGYVFTGWSGTITSSIDTLEINVDNVDNIIANYQKVLEFPTIVINEINYNSNPNYDTEDWVELYNFGNEIIDLTDWIFKDEIDTNIFVFPPSTLLMPDSYLVICRNIESFKLLNSSAEPVIGNITFGLSNGGELLRLYNSSGQLVDSVRYKDGSALAD